MVINEKFLSTGSPYPLGATPDNDGVNFAVFSEHAHHIELCFFDEYGKQCSVVSMCGPVNGVWHVYVAGIKPGQNYGYRAHGEYAPEKGHRFNPSKLLIDPYARALTSTFEWRDEVFGFETQDPKSDVNIDQRDSAPYVPKSIVVDDNAITSNSLPHCRPKYDWSDTVIYETHVKGITQSHNDVSAQLRGSFAGLATPRVLEYIRSLGVTTLELLPVHSFIDEQFLFKHGLKNYWGYNTLNFFTPHAGYLSSGHISEFKQFVDAAHDAQLEVVLDVVYNHTAEGNHLGPTLCFKGLDNYNYYSLAQHDSHVYVNDTGCGNTLNIRHPRVLQLVMDSLRYWAGTMGVDGFRFDLATVLGRESNGFNNNGAFFQAVQQDPILSRCKLIAEPWDIGPGGYQLGGFPCAWSEWNDRYRDTVRRFWRGDLGMLPEVARRVHGSSDIFEHSGRRPSASINFVTSHDGFTLTDLVSYNQRNNFANKEDNNDGHHANFSDNCGLEGSTEDVNVLALRERQKRNFLATLFLSQGTPMLLGGDEFGRSQQGNNNAYCQDSPISWFTWPEAQSSGVAMQAFVRRLSAIRGRCSLLTSNRYIHLPDEPDEGGVSSVRWYSISGTEMREEQWSEQHIHTLGWLLERQSVNASESSQAQEPSALFVMFNASSEDVVFNLPLVTSVKQWRCIVNTVLDGDDANEMTYQSIDSVSMEHKSLRFFVAEF